MSRVNIFHYFYFGSLSLGIFGNSRALAATAVAGYVYIRADLIVELANIVPGYSSADAASGNYMHFIVGSRRGVHFEKRVHARNRSISFALVSPSRPCISHTRGRPRAPEKNYFLYSILLLLL